MTTITKIKERLTTGNGSAPAQSQGMLPAFYLGMLEYDAALELQELMMKAVVEDRIPGALLLMQHPAVFTTGRFRGDNELLVSSGMLEEQGIKVITTNRGGSITCHEPGQLVCYPIIDLKRHSIGVRDYVWRLEEVIIRTLSAFNIEGIRIQIYPGVWVEDKKICSIGIHVQHHVTMHGLALNVNNDLRNFELINPCGIKNISMTSMSRIAGHAVDMNSVVAEMVASFSSVFDCGCCREECA